MAEKLPEKGVQGKQGPSDAEAGARAEADSEARWTEVPPRPWPATNHAPTETGMFAALLVDEDPSLEAFVKWNHEHNGHPATVEHLRAAREIAAELVDALRYSYDANGVLPRIEAARIALKGGPIGIEERRARYVQFIRVAWERYAESKAKGGVFVGYARDDLRSSFRWLAVHYGQGFSGLPFEDFERAIAAIDSTKRLRLEAAELAIRAGELGCSKGEAPDLFAEDLRTAVKRRGMHSF